MNVYFACRGSSNRNASKDESNEGDDESVEDWGESIEAGEMHLNRFMIGINYPF